MGWNVVSLFYLPTDDNVADMLTKRLGFSKVQNLCALIGLTLVVNKQPSTHGSCSGGRKHCSAEVEWLRDDVANRVMRCT